MPRVSVIIPTYNRAHVVGEAIDSVLAQTYRDFEIIVVDDASTDNTQEVLARYLSEHGERIRYIRRETNGGAGAARNDGIRVSTGEFIAFLDSDDLYLPARLHAAVEFLDHRPKYEAAYSNYATVGPHGELPARGALRSRGLFPSGHIFREILKHVVVCTDVITVRRSAILKAGLFDETLRRAEDFEYWARLSRVSQIGFHPDVLAVIRPFIAGHRDLRALSSAVPGAASDKLLRATPALKPAEARILRAQVAPAYRWRGTLLWRFGRRREARAWFRRALAYAWQHRLWRELAEVWLAARAPILAESCGWLWRRTRPLRAALACLRRRM